MNASKGTEAITDEKLVEIEERWSKTTAGPWKSYVEVRDQISGSDFIMTGGEDIYLTGASVHDQDFIAAAHQDVPMLLLEVRRLRAILRAK